MSTFFSSPLLACIQWEKLSSFRSNPGRSRGCPGKEWLRTAPWPGAKQNYWAHHVAEMNKMTTHHRGAARLRARALGDGPSRRIPCSVSTLRLKNAKVPILLPCQHHRATGPVRQMASPFTLRRSQRTMSWWKPLLLRQLSAKSLLG